MKSSPSTCLERERYRADFGGEAVDEDVQRRTAAVAAGLLLLLGSVVIVGVVVSGSTLEEQWVSDTPRNNERNHHSVDAGPNGSVIVAPIAEVPKSDVTLSPEACSLVRLSPENGDIKWRDTVPPKKCFTHALTQPAIDDLDGDGTLEVVVASTENAIIVHSAANGTERWRINMPAYGYGQPAVGDLTESAGKEIVASDIKGNLVAIHANGTVAWRTSLRERIWNRSSVYERPRVTDIDGDGSQEVLVGTTSGVAVLDATGQIQWHRNKTARYLTSARMGDGESPTVFTSGYDGIWAFDEAAGEMKWERGLSNTRIGPAETVDGRQLLFAGVYGGEIAALDAQSGETIWTTQIASEDAIVPPPVLTDVGGDERPEIVAVANDGTVAVLDAASGAELAAYERTVPVWTSATPADIDGDGNTELLVMFGDGRVVALDYTPSMFDQVFG